MKSRFGKPAPSDQLSMLAEILESGEPVPSDLAVNCATLIRKALQDGGKLPLKTGPGQPTNKVIRFERAFAVAMLMIDARLKPHAAIQQVADSHSKDFDTIRKDYAEWCELVIDQAHRKIYVRDTILPAIDEVKILLATFECGNGCKLSDADIDKLFSWLPASEVPELVKKIKNSSLHRDMRLLDKLLD